MKKKKNGRKGQAEYFEWGGAQILRSASDCRTDPLFPTDRWTECTPHTRHTRHNKHRTDSTSTSKLPLPLLSLRLLDISINSAATRHNNQETSSATRSTLQRQVLKTPGKQPLLPWIAPTWTPIALPAWLVHNLAQVCDGVTF